MHKGQCTSCKLPQGTWRQSMQQQQQSASWQGGANPWPLFWRERAEAACFRLSVSLRSRSLECSLHGSLLTSQPGTG